MRKLLLDAFGSTDLYKILGNNVSKSSSLAQLRKAYYKCAIQFHPDKNPNGHLQFQAINTIYEYLTTSEENRATYNETGIVPDQDDTDTTKEGVDLWKQYFERMFGRVTVSHIDEFRDKYKLSEDERQDVLKEFVKQRGNLVKMLDFVVLSEPCDAVRWVTDYLRPAMEGGELDDTYKNVMEKTLKTCQKRVQEAADETESEQDDDSEPPAKTPNPSKKKKTAAKKRKKAANNDMTDLIAQIQNKNRMAHLGARYGVHNTDDDPLDDAAFARARARLKK